LQWCLLSTLLLLYFAAIKIQEANDSIDEEDPRPSSSNGATSLCGENLELKRGREIHGMVITNGFRSSLFAMTSVVNLYSKCRQIEDACKMFERIPQRDSVSWNTVVVGYA